MFEHIEIVVGEIGQTHVVFGSRYVDERVRSIEAYDIAQLDEALTRYEFTAG